MLKDCTLFINTTPSLSLLALFKLALSFRKERKKRPKEMPQILYAIWVAVDVVINNNCHGAQKSLLL